MAWYAKYDCGHWANKTYGINALRNPPEFYCQRYRKVVAVEFLPAKPRRRGSESPGLDTPPLF